MWAEQCDSISISGVKKDETFLRSTQSMYDINKVEMSVDTVSEYYWAVSIDNVEVYYIDCAHGTYIDNVRVVNRFIKYLESYQRTIDTEIELVFNIKKFIDDFDDNIELYISYFDNSNLYYNHFFYNFNYYDYVVGNKLDIKNLIKDVYNLGDLM